MKLSKDLQQPRKHFHLLDRLHNQQKNSTNPKKSQNPQTQEQPDHDLTKIIAGTYKQTPDLIIPPKIETSEPELIKKLTYPKKSAEPKSANRKKSKSGKKLIESKKSEELETLSTCLDVIELCLTNCASEISINSSIDTVHNKRILRANNSDKNLAQLTPIQFFDQLKNLKTCADVCYKSEECKDLAPKGKIYEKCSSKLSICDAKCHTGDIRENSHLKHHQGSNCVSGCLGEVCDTVEEYDQQEQNFKVKFNAHYDRLVEIGKKRLNDQGYNEQWFKESEYTLNTAK